MTDVPKHPDVNDLGARQGDRTAGTRPWWQYAVLAGVIVLLALMVVLHLAGLIGPGSH